MLVVGSFDAPGYDLSALLVGAKLVADGHASQLYAHDPVQYNLANGEAFERAAHALGFTGGAPTAFVHPPLVAWLAQPLTRAPFATVVHVWLVLSAFALAAALWLSLDVFAPRWRNAPTLAALMFAMLAFEPARYSFWLAQTTPWIMLAVVGALALERRDKLLLAGLVMSLAAFVKLTPLVFALIWLWQGKRRALAGLGAGLGGLSVVSVATMGIDANVTFVHRVGEIGRISLVAFNNHSIGAFVMRFFVPHEEIERFTMFRTAVVARVAVVLVAAVLVLVPVWSLRGRRNDPLVHGFALLVILLVPNIAWTHYFVLLVPVGMLALARTETPRARALVGAACAFAYALCARPIAPDESQFPTHRGLVIVGPTLAAAVMAIVLSSLAFRARSRS